MLRYISVFAIIIFFTSFLSFSEANVGLTVFDDNYIVEKFVSGLDFPTTMDFVGNDLLVLEKMTGKVIRINENGEIDKEPVLVVPAAQDAEGGLLGIATTHNHVFYILQNIGQHIIHTYQQKILFINTIGMERT